MKESLGTIIKEARKKHNLSQNALATIINTTQQSIANWEKDKNKPDISVLKSLCQELNINYEQVKEKYYDKKVNLEKNKKIIKKILIILLISICIILPIMSMILIINRNKVNVYYASIDSSTIVISEFVFIETSDEYILKPGVVTSKMDDDCNVLIYYEDKDTKERKQINEYKCNYNPFVMQKKEDTLYFGKNFDINDDIFISIYFDNNKDKSYNYKLNFRKLYSYEKIFNSYLGAYY